MDTPQGGHQLRFRALAAGGRNFVFPCDAHGRVDLDALGERARTDYLYARAVVGCELARPRVEPAVPRERYDSGGVAAGGWRTRAACSCA